MANDAAHTFGDARLEELKLLAEIDRMGTFRFIPQQEPQRAMVVWLVTERLANDFDFPWSQNPEQSSGGLPGESDLERSQHQRYLTTLRCLLAGQEVSLRLSHKGRIRLSELKQALTAGKIREPFCILWDGRHFDSDLQVALVDASEKSPLSLICLDMNRLKAINDQWGHLAGDSCLRAYFQAVAAAISDKGNAYRVGGDEVFAILPTFNRAAAKSLSKTSCSLLMKEKVRITEDQHVSLAVSVGIATTTDPGTEFEQLKKNGDDAMYRAKEEAKNAGNSCSGIAMHGEEEVLLVEQP